MIDQPRSAPGAPGPRPLRAQAGIWLAGSVALLTMLGARFDATEAPLLSPPPKGLSVVSVETQTVQMAPEGTIKLHVESTDIAIRSLSIATFGTSGEVEIEVVKPVRGA